MTERFGPLLTRRECGACVACCQVPRIDALEKPADVMCHHCTEQGCGIYDQRPEACRSFFCGWRRLPELPENLRPDRCGFIVMLEHAPDAPNPFDRLNIVARWIDGTPTADHPAVIRLIKLLRHRMVPIFISAAQSDSKRLVYPDAAVYAAIVHGQAVPEADRLVRRRVEQWREALLPQTALTQEGNRIHL